MIIKNINHLLEKIHSDSKEDILARLKSIIDIQNTHGNWDYDAYMMGLANGLICADAVVRDEEGFEPKYKEKPKKGFIGEGLEGIEYHKELNPKLWDNFELKPEVRKHLLEVAKLFFKFIEVDWVDIEDIVITGSTSNFNYTKYSDIDIHLVVDFDKVHDDCPLVDGYFRTKKTLFGKKHDITIKGFPVELYVEDVNNTATSEGVYSILNDKWVKKPEYKLPSLNNSAIKQKFNHYKEEVQEIIKLKNIGKGEELLEKIWKMRQSGLEKAGEFSIENIVFKLLRNLKYIDKVKDFINDKEDKDLTL
jgi:hypothetical protein